MFKWGHSVPASHGSGLPVAGLAFMQFNWWLMALRQAAKMTSKADASTGYVEIAAKSLYVVLQPGASGHSRAHIPTKTRLVAWTLASKTLLWPAVHTIVTDQPSQPSARGSIYCLLAMLCAA